MIRASKRTLLASLLVLSMACSDDDDGTDTGNDPGTANNAGDNNGAANGSGDNAGDNGGTTGEANDGDTSTNGTGSTGSGNPATGGKPGEDGGVDAGGSGGTGTTSGSSGDAGAEDLEDGEIVAITGAANLGAIKQAELALLRAKQTAVRELAQTTATEHGAAQTRQLKIVAELGIIARESDDSEKLSQQAGMLHGGLEAADAEAFDVAYVNAQVTLNQAVLDLLNKKLIPSADQMAISEELQTLRTAVESHLKEAQELKQQLGG